MTDEAFIRGLVAELAKKTGVCWLRYAAGDGPAETHPAWHLWYDGALYVVHGGDEQPLPGIDDAVTVEVLMRSKDNGGRLVTWAARPSVVPPGDPLWEPVTAALVGERLNLDDLSSAADTWARQSTVTRLEPGDEVVEEPGRLSDDAHLHAPKGSPALTRGPLPRVLHRRVRRRPPLS